MKKSDTYSTTDLGLAAALRCAGTELATLDSQNGSRVSFVFHRTENLTNLIEKYWSGHLNVDALSYFNALKTLKNMIYSSRPRI